MLNKVDKPTRLHTDKIVGTLWLERKKNPQWSKLIIKSNFDENQLMEIRHCFWTVAQENQFKKHTNELAWPKMMVPQENNLTIGT